MVSVTVLVVSVVLVMLPWVKFGTTGTARAVCAVARTDATATRTRFIMFMTHRTVSSVTNCPVACVPAPPAVKVIAPAEVIVPARVPAVPAALLVIEPKLPTSPTETAEVGTASA